MAPGVAIHTGTGDAFPAARLWRVDDKYYDLAAFQESHPGGAHVLQQPWLDLLVAFSYVSRFDY